VSREPRYATPTDLPLPPICAEPPQHLPWSAALEAQLRAVAQELGLSPEAGAALARAAQGRRIPSNPGILLAQVRAAARPPARPPVGAGLVPRMRSPAAARCRPALTPRPHLAAAAAAQAVRLLAAFEPLLPSRAELLAMLAAHPGLLAHSAATLASNYGAMATVLPPAQLRQLLLRVPTLLTLSPFSFWSNLHGLGMMLDLPAGRLGALALRAPRLLTTSPALLQQRFDALGHYFDLAPAEVRGLVRRQPLLLASHASTLQANAELLVQRLGLPPHLVVRMILKQPALLLVSGERPPAACSPACSALCVVGAAVGWVAAGRCRPPGLACRAASARHPLKAGAASSARLLFRLDAT
jgi:hypothetical protein